MERTRFTQFFAGPLLALGLCAVLTENSAQAQISIGPGGISVGGGSVYIPFDNGRDYGRGGYYGRDGLDRGGYYGRSDFNRGGYYGRGGIYGPRDYFYDGRGVYGSGYGRSGIYWTPGVYWAPNNYWYGDQYWGRYETSIPRNWNVVPQDGANYDVRAEARPELPPVPELEELERMNWTHLRRVLSYGANQLKFSLEQVNTGSGWIKYLQVDSLQAIVTNDEDVPPTNSEANQLMKMLERYNQTADNASYATIANQWGFETIHRGLSEFLQNPASRYRRQLIVHSADLDQALEKFSTGPGWQQHLTLPAELFIDMSDAEAAKNPPDPEKMRKALQRYDEVAKNPSYRVINELPEFQTTHATLARYLGRLPQAAESTSDSVDNFTPPEDPSLHEPAPVDPSQLQQPSAASERPAVEELVPPSSEPSPSPTKPANGPAVREKE